MRVIKAPSGLSLLKPLGKGQGYLKAGFLGFPKAGKTYTAVELAIGTRAALGAKGPIAMFDTEGGSEYIAKIVRDRTGLDLIGIRSMAFDDLISATEECEREGISVLVIDSITHVWRELQESYLAKVNEGRQAKRMSKRYNLEFQDWGPLKRKWAEWTDLYLNSKLHIIICGRAGFEYDYETNAETGKKDLVKTGTKMKTESEFGFEPSLLVEMERIRSGKKMLHRAIVLGDRFGIIDGKTCDNPTFDFFSPYIDRLKPGGYAPIDMTVKSDPGIDVDGNDDRRLKTILLEEIEGELVAAFPSTSVKDKTAKNSIIADVFQTKSWTAICGYSPERLRSGLHKIRSLLREIDVPAPPAEAKDEQ